MSEFDTIELDLNEAEIAIFALGYDLLREALAEQGLPFDIAYVLCEEVYEAFCESECESLRAYVDANKEHIDYIIEETANFLKCKKEGR